MLRKNFLTGEDVFLSPERANRTQYTKDKTNKKCPFCLENKHMITNPIYTDFCEEIRIIYNKYPIIDKNPYGEHYVLIDTKSHDKNIEDYSKEHLFRIMKAIKYIFDISYKDNQLKSVQVFKNKGYGAGASIEHSHWQIVCLDMITKKQETIINHFAEHSKNKNTCYLCCVDYTGVVTCENEHFVAFCPKDAIFPYTLNIIPKNHITNFRYLTEVMLENLGEILKCSIISLNNLFQDIDYNIFIYSGLREVDEYHFFIEILPRTGNFGGFELSTGMYVNSVLSKDAAKKFRDS